MIGQVLGHYRIDEQLGAGGMGVVYRVHDTRLERDVALKVLPPGMLADENARKRFRKEALALSRLNHPNIATVHDFDSHQGVDFLVMELIPGVSLDARVTQGPHAEKELLQIGAQVADGLAAAHAEGVLHRDLKPANLRVTPDGRVKILDFGLARLIQPVTATAATATASELHAIAGTLPYMAPEQFESNRVDARTDVYAAGAVLYELATGHRVFEERDSTPRLINAILNEAPPPPSSVNPRLSPGLENIILKALDKDPDRRYQSARELAVDLQRLSVPSSAVTMVRPRARPRLRPLLIGALALPLLLAIAVALNVGGLRDRFGAGSRPIQSLAVLPLTNVSADPQQEYFVDGMTHELIGQLGRIGALRVTSRTSVMLYKGSKKPLRQIAEELKVGKILEGSVLRSGDRARITVQLIDATADQQLWSETYDRDVRDILQLQSDLARAVAEEIRVRLTRQEEARLEVAARAIHPEAHEEFLRGVYNQMKRPPDQAKAKEHLERAIQLDPNYAPAYAALGDTYVGRAFFLNPLPPMQVFPKMKEVALKALQIDPSFAPAYVHLGIVRLHHEWDWKGAEDAFKRAAELNPSLAPAHHWYAHYLLVMDRVEESVAASQRAAELDPVNVTWASCYGWHCLYARQYDLAIDQSLKALAMNPQHFLAHVYLGRAYAEKKKFDQALAELQNAVTLSGGSPSVVAALAHTYAEAGEGDEARKILTQLEQRAKEKYVSPYDFAVIYAGLGDKDRAFEWLDKAYFERATWVLHIKWDERFADIRSDPRFRDLLERMNLPT